MTATHAPPASAKVKAVSPPEVFAFPVSSGQQRLWFLEQLQPGTPLYNIPIAVRLEGPLDADVLAQAINQIIRRHEILRTRFNLQNGEPVQIVEPALTLNLPVVDLQSQPQDGRENEARRLSAEEARLPFDLKRLPLLRVKLLRLAAREHILVLTVHHIIFDQWSLTIFFRELAAIYDQLRAGNRSDLPEPPIQYADYAVWQRGRLRLVGPELAWWKRRLGGGRPALELPTDRPRAGVQTYRGAVESLKLPGGLHGALQSLCQQTGVTLFTTLLAALQTLLHRYTGQEEILVGSPSAGRMPSETERVIGLFSNTLVMRGDLAGNPTLRQLLERVRTTALGSHDNEEVPFEKVVEALQPERSLSHPPLFQVMFALERAPLESVIWPELKLTQMELDSGTAKFDLTLCMIESAGSLTARLEYNTDLFDSASIRRMLTHFESLLAGIARDPGQHLSDLPLLTESERHQVLVEWNRTNADYPRDKTIHELFEAQAARTPDAVAAVAGDQCLTYRELDGRANQVARYLGNLGAQPETLVAICLERSLATMAGLLGVLKAGGAYLPLDPVYPKEPLAFILKDSKAAVLLTQQRLLNALPRSKARRVCLDSDWKLISNESRDKPSTQVTPENLACVVFTSGSSGKPQGVQITHRAMVNFLNSMRREPGLSRDDTLLALSDLSFDIAGLELLLPLTVGARVVLASSEEAADATLLAEKIAATGITAMQAAPATWRLLLDSRWAGSKSLKALSGGEGLSRELADRLLERCGELWNLYGATETTICSSVARIEPGAGPIVLGRPVANTRFHILDRYFQPVPVGVPGELFIGGDGLARGYLDRPELTAGKFIRDPFNGDPAARLYRTGDLGRRLSDGNIELLGRVDQQVNIRGRRIELGEIEAMLLQFPQVREAVVIAREDTPGDKQLAAYLTTYQQTTVSLNELRRFLREKLPEYMIPTAFVTLDKLPLTPDGKMDRRALPPPESHRPKPETTFATPHSGLEQTIAAVWEEVLCIKSPGVNENFFDLGGHSMQVVQVQSQLRERVGADLPVLILFEHPTIRSLAGFLREDKKEDPIAQRIHDRTQRQKAATPRVRQFGARVKL